jgi:kynurenine formamidase
MLLPPRARRLERSMILQALTAGTLALGAALGVGACSGVAPDRGPFPDGDLVDLSHAYDEEAIFWPTAEGFRLQRVADGITAGGYYYAANNFCTSEHGGTHLDAPVHFAKGAQSVDRVPLDALIGAAIVVDVTAQAEANADYEVGLDDFARWERTHGDMPAGAIVLVRTGYAERWPDAARYLGSSERGPDAVAKLHFPGIHPDAAVWLATERRVKAVGIDTASIDRGQSTTFLTHRALYERNVPGLENLANLDRLPARGAWLIALPMKIRNGTGAPLRAVAVIPRER